jgi:hypothetical protein
MSAKPSNTDGLHFPVRRSVSPGVGGYTLNKSKATRQIVESLRRAGALK